MTIYVLLKVLLSTVAGLNVDNLNDVHIDGNEKIEFEHEVDVEVVESDFDSDSEYGLEDEENITDSDDETDDDLFCESDEELIQARKNERAAKQSTKTDKRERKNVEEVEDLEEMRQDETCINERENEMGERPPNTGWVEVDYDSDKLETPETSENEVDEVKTNKMKKRKVHEFNPKTDIKNVEFSVGMIFPNYLEFKEAVKHYGIGKKYNVHFSKISRDMMQVKCEVGCPWSLWASELKNEKTFQVKSYNNVHKCTNKQKK